MKLCCHNIADSVQESKELFPTFKSSKIPRGRQDCRRSILVACNFINYWHISTTQMCTRAALFMSHQKRFGWLSTSDTKQIFFGTLKDIYMNYLFVKFCMCVNKEVLWWMGGCINIQMPKTNKLANSMIHLYSSLMRTYRLLMNY